MSTLAPRRTRSHEPSQADAVIIGAGIAGLTAAALLAKRGYKVIVLERDVHPGGCAAGYSQDGYRFAVGATVAMGFEPGGLHHKIYQHLGLKPHYVEVDPAIRVHLPDRTVEIKTDRDAWFLELARAFPGQQRAKRAFWQEVSRVAAGMHHAANHFPVMPFRHLWDVLDTAKAAHPKLLPAFFALRRTVADRLEHYNLDDPAHHAFIDGQLLDAMQTGAEQCVMANGALALDIYRFGCQYKIGGLESIAQDLVQYLESRGGEVRYAGKVRRILQDGSRVRGVDSTRGEIHAPMVISAIPLANTAALLEDPSFSNLTARAEKLPEMWGAFTLYLGVDERCLPGDTHVYEQLTSLSPEDEAGNLLISTAPAWDRSRAPEGKRAITVSTHVHAAEWMTLAHERGAYAAAKRQLEDTILTRIEQVFPRIRQGIEVFQSGTPKTFHNFTLRAGGTVGGIPQTSHTANFAAPSHRTDLAGLILAGDTIFPGQGTLGVSVSGYNAARTAARTLKHSQHSTQRSTSHQEAYA